MTSRRTIPFRECHSGSHGFSHGTLREVSFNSPGLWGFGLLMTWCRVFTDLFFWVCRQAFEPRFLVQGVWESRPPNQSKALKQKPAVVLLASDSKA